METDETLQDQTIADGVYNLTPTTECHLKATSDEQADKIWFTTPVSTLNGASFLMILTRRRF